MTERVDPKLAALRPLTGGAIVIIVVCCMCWGISQAAVKTANTGIPPLLQAGLRSTFAGLLVYAWAMFRGISLFERDGTLPAGLIIGISFAANFMLAYPGLQYTTASRGVLFIYAMPFFVAIGAHFLIPGDRLTVPKIAGLAAAFVGLALALGEGLTGGMSPETSTLLGDLMCFGSAVGWAFSTLLMRTTRLRYAPAEKTLLYQLVVSAPLLVLASLVIGEGPPSFSDPIVVASFAYTVVVVAFISYGTWIWLLSRHPASAVTSFTFLAPVFGVIGGAVLLGETISLRTWAALVLVALGIALVNKPVRAATAKP